MYFTTLVILTWKQLISFCIVVSDSLWGKIIYTSALRQKSSSKATELIGILLAIDSVSLIFTDGGVNQYLWYQALWGRIDLFNRVLGTELLLVKGV